MGFFASPGVKVVKKALEQRNAKAGVVTDKKSGDLKRTASTDSLSSSREPVMGISADMEEELDEMVREVKREVEVRRARSRENSLVKDMKKAM